MVSTVKKAFDSYFSQLESSGNVTRKESSILLISYFLKDYLYSGEVEVTQDILDKVQEIMECFAKNSCLLKEIPSLYISDF